MEYCLICSNAMNFRLHLILFILPGWLFAQDITPYETNNAFSFGEELSYKMSYSLYLKIPVAELNLKLLEKPAVIKNKNHYHFFATAKTYRFYDPFFKVRDKFESFVDMQNFTPVYALNNYNEGSYHSKKYYIMDHEKGLVRNNNGKKSSIPYLTQDILSAVYLARTFDLNGAQPGDSFMLNLYIDDSLYYIGFIYSGKEKIKFGSDKITCLKIKPILIVDRVFKSDEDMIVWVTDDENKIPLKIHSGISVGSITATLTNYSGLKSPMRKD